MFSQSTIDKISAVARDLDIEDAALLAVADVESAGVAYWSVGAKQLPAIRFEGHYFYRLLSGAKRDRAVALGLANPKAGAIPNPSAYAARYALLERARAINVDVANESTSWGLGQVMGAHWSKLGFKNVQELVDLAMSGVSGQVTIMADYIRVFGLADELAGRKWLAFANAYNGPASQKNNYAAKIEAAYQKYSAIRKTAVGTPRADDAHMVSTVDLQRALGLPEDGIFGTQTRAAVKAFQAEHGLVADGIPGPMTRAALDAAISSQREARTAAVSRTGAVAAGLVATAGVAAPVAGASPIAGLGVVGAAALLAAWQWWRAK